MFYVALSACFFGIITHNLNFIFVRRGAMIPRSGLGGRPDGASGWGKWKMKSGILLRSAAVALALALSACGPQSASRSEAPRASAAAAGQEAGQAAQQQAPGAIATDAQGSQAESASEGSAPSNGAAKKVMVAAIVEHPALIEIRDGILEGLEAKGWKQGENLDFRYQTAQGSMPIAKQIANQFVSEKPDVMIGIATPTAQAMAAATKEVPIVFAAVTDPIAAGLVDSMGPSGTNIAGYSDVLPVDRQVGLMEKLVPGLKDIGYVYSPGEANSVSVLAQLRDVAQKEGLTVRPAPAQRTADIPVAARSLAGKVQVIYTPLDNNVASAYESLFRVAKEIKIPLVASNAEALKSGATAVLGYDQKNMSVEISGLVDRVLRGEKPGDIPVMLASHFEIHVNTDNAKAVGFEIPQEVLKAAKTVNGMPNDAPAARGGRS